MAWFSRKDKDVDGGLGDAAAPGASDDEVKAGVPAYDAEVLLRPIFAPVTDEQQARIDAGLARLAELGADVDDLVSLGAAYDRTWTSWSETSKRQREEDVVAREPFVIGLGEHLARHTDLAWSLVRDAFGTDLAVAGGKDEFVVVPANLVAARWLGGERGWLPGVVAHLVRVRDDRREA